MIFNKDLIETRIMEINDAIEEIEKITRKEYSELTLYEKLSLRYLIIQLVEAAATICVHIITRVYGEQPHGYSDCFIRLGIKGVIPSSLAYELACVARLRNLLVHRYWEIDDEKIYYSVKNDLTVFRDYINYIRIFMVRGAYEHR